MTVILHVLFGFAIMAYVGLMAAFIPAIWRGIKQSLSRTED